MGSLFKQIYRYTRPRRFRHNENLWPWVKITRAAAGHISSLSIDGTPLPIADLSALKQSQSGDVLLVASGPSVSHTDFSTLNQLPAMGMNGAWFMHEQLNFRLFIIVDLTFIDQRASTVREIISAPDVIFFTTVNSVFKIVRQFGIEALRCKVCIIEDACEKIFQPKVEKSEIGEKYENEGFVKIDKNINNIAFSTDIRKGIFDAGTVAYWALQILLYLGFSRIIIAGLDMNNFNTPRFYESEHDIAPSYLEQQFTTLIKPAFIHASEIFRKEKVEVLNLSLESSLDESIFRKISTNEI